MRALQTGGQQLSTVIIVLAVIYSSQAIYLTLFSPPPATHTTSTMHTTPSPSYHAHHSLPLLPCTPLSPPPTMHIPPPPPPPPFCLAHHSLLPLAMHNTASLSCHAQIYTASVPAGTDEEMNGTLDKDETVRYHFPIPVIGITVKVCISAGHILVYGSVLVPNPNSAFYDWMLELDYEHNDQEIEMCKNVFIDPSTIQHKHPAEDKVSSTITFPPSPTSSPQPSISPGSGFSPGTVLSDEILYISVMGKQNENNFVLSDTEGDIYPESDSSPEPKPGKCLHIQHSCPHLRFRITNT